MQTMESFVSFVCMNKIMCALSLVALAHACLLVWKTYVRKMNQQCYIVDYACYKPSEERKLSTELCAEIVQRNTNLGLEEFQFLLKIIVASGIGEETYAPRDIIEGKDPVGLQSSIEEMDEGFFASLDDLFKNTGVDPTDIDLLVVNVSMLVTSPCLASRVVNRYKMKESVKVYDLSGMGCSASIISISAVKNYFKVHENSLAIVVTTECMGPNWYTGTEKSMMITNCLFRSGCCSILLSNNQAYRNRAKLRLKLLTQTHIGASDEDYGCAIQREDKQGVTGFWLGKNLIQAAAKALRANLTVVAPQVLPVKETVKYLMKRYITKNKGESGTSQIDFKTGIDHFCIHAGGSAVIDGVGKSLGLSTYDLEPARMALYRFGNTSASGIWYVLAYMEAKKRLKKGNKVFQISLGSGFMCNSAVWEVLRDLDDKGVWEDCIDYYPPKKTTNPFMEKFGWIKDLTTLPALPLNVWG